MQVPADALPVLAVLPGPRGGGHRGPAHVLGRAPLRKHPPGGFEGDFIRVIGFYQWDFIRFVVLWRAIVLG